VAAVPSGQLAKENDDGSRSCVPVREWLTVGGSKKVLGMPVDCGTLKGEVGVVSNGVAVDLFRFFSGVCMTV
jgi:hypothetical protein